MKRLFLLLTFILVAVPAFATTYYTAKDCTGGSAPPNCSDANNGTSRQTAKLTIAAGLALLGTADTLIVGNGTYAAPILITADVPVAEGSNDANHLIVKAENNHGAIITGCSADGNNLELFDRSYVTIDGFDFNAAACTHTNITVGAIVNMAGFPGAHYILIKNSILRNALVFTCFAFRGASNNLNDHITVQNNIVHDCGTSYPTTDGFAGHGIYFDAPNSTLEGNTVYNIGEGAHGLSPFGIHIYEGVHCNTNDSIIVRNNTIHDTAGGGILYDCGDNGQVYNNVVYGLTRTMDFSGISVADGTGTVAYSNTIVDGAGRCMNFISTTNAVAKNNICWGNTTNTIADNGGGYGANTNLTRSNNLCTTTGGCVTGSDPLFISQTGHNYHLTAASPAIDQGATLGSPFTLDFDGVPRGTAYDIGAFEFASNVVPPACSFDVCETFDNYTLSADLTTLCSGTGWTDCWTRGTGTVTIGVAPAGGQGGYSALLQGSAAIPTSYGRHFTSAAATTMRFLMRLSVNAESSPTGAVGVALAGENGTITIIKHAGATVTMLNGGTAMYDTLIDYGSSGNGENRWITIDCEVDDSGHNDQFRCRADLGAWSSWLTSTSTFTGMSSLELFDQVSETHSFWVDAIGGAPTVPTTSRYNIFAAAGIR